MPAALVCLRAASPGPGARPTWSRRRAAAADVLPLGHGRVVVELEGTQGVKRQQEETETETEGGDSLNQRQAQGTAAPSGTGTRSDRAGCKLLDAE